MTTTLQHTVPPHIPPDRADRYLARAFPQISRSRMQKLIIEGRVRLNGRPLRKPSTTVSGGEEFELEVPEVEPQHLKPEKIPLNVLHEDNWILVVDKPAGLVVHPGAGHSGGTLVNALLAHGTRLSSARGEFKPGLVHRLDKDTSGLMVIAKDDATHLNLSRQFAGRSVLRVYLAAVKGVVQRDQGTIEAPIGRHPVHRKRMAVRADAREAVTRYKVLRRYRGATFLELKPETGRTHQLRVHLASIGHPILGDAEYGVRAGFPRQALHAHRLGFRHPGIEQWVEFSSPWPPQLERAMKSLN